MNLVLLAITTIDLFLAIVILIAGIYLVKRQDRLRHDYFLCKKRARTLREVKELYYSYCLYRADLDKETDFLLKLGKINQLARNNFFGSKLALFNQLDQPQNYIQFKEKINELDLLADEINILFPNQPAHTVETFLFWYRTLLLEIGAYKKEGDNASYVCTIEIKLKHLEEVYKTIEESFLLGELGTLVKVKG